MDFCRFIRDTKYITISGMSVSFYRVDWPVSISFKVGRVTLSIRVTVYLSTR